MVFVELVVMRFREISVHREIEIAVRISVQLRPQTERHTFGNQGLSRIVIDIHWTPFVLTAPTDVFAVLLCVGFA